MYKIIFMTQAQKDAKKLASSGLKPKVLQLIKIIEEDPLQYPPDYEFLICDPLKRVYKPKRELRRFAPQLSFWF